MFGNIGKKVANNINFGSNVFTALIESYHRTKSERLAEYVVDSYLGGQIISGKTAVINHSESAKNNCRGLNCQPISGVIVGKPYLSDTRRTLLVNLRLADKSIKKMGLLTMNNEGWQTTGWEIENKEEGNSNNA